MLHTIWNTFGQYQRVLEAENKLGLQTGVKIKIVERTGVQLQQILTKSNPWSGEDCGRMNCLLCHTKAASEKNKSQDCHKRNLVYETKCLTCETRDEEYINSLEIEDKEKSER